MIGLSLSWCVKDIIEGKVELDEVEKIICGTRIENPQHFEQVCEHYCAYYWEHNRGRAVLIASKLFNSGKLDQPRVRGEEPPNTCEGHWIVDGKQTHLN